MPSVERARQQDRLVASSLVARHSLPRSERERIVPLSVAQVQALAQLDSEDRTRRAIDTAFTDNLIKIALAACVADSLPNRTQMRILHTKFGEFLFHALQ
jgi:hypothetical protein